MTRGENEPSSQLLTIRRVIRKQKSAYEGAGWQDVGECVRECVSVGYACEGSKASYSLLFAGKA